MGNPLRELKFQKRDNSRVIRIAELAIVLGDASDCHQVIPLRACNRRRIPFWRSIRSIDPLHRPD